MTSYSVKSPPSRKDRDWAEAVQFERLKAELGVAFAAPDDSYNALSAEEVIARNSNCKDI